MFDFQYASVYLLTHFAFSALVRPVASMSSVPNINKIGCRAEFHVCDYITGGS